MTLKQLFDFFTPDLLSFLQTIIGAAIGSGLTLAIFKHFLSVRESKRQEEARFISDQIRMLYAPLHFEIVKYSQLFHLSDQIMTKAREIFDENRKKSGGSPDKIRTMDFKEAIELSNRYVRRGISDRNKMLSIIQDGWTFHHPDDLPVFIEFFSDCVRYEEEHLYYLQSQGDQESSEAVSELPFELMLKLEPVSLKRDAFIETIQDRFSSLRSRLRTLQPVTTNSAG